VQNAPRVVHVFWPESRHAARVGLRPPLAPEILGRGHPGQDPVLLLGRPEREDGRREQEDAVLRHTLWATRSVVLLLEDQPLHR
jgi:hypothetical protein